MKKEYINPEMLVIKMQTMTVLAASDLDVSKDEATTTGGYYNEASQWFGPDSEDEEDW